MKLMTVVLSSMLVASLAASAHGRPTFARQHFPKAPFEDGVIVGADHREHHIQYQVINGRNVWQGDIQLQPFKRKGVSTEGFALADVGSRWPNGIINYCFSSNLSDAQKSMAHTAMSTWNAAAGISFHDNGSPCEGVAHRATATEVQIVSWENSYCLATVGYTGDVTEYVHIAASADYCDAGTVTHEIGHLLGLLHEQSRPDRDKYVTIHKENMIDGEDDQFDIDDAGTTTLDTPYDCSSIMHYTPFEFAKDDAPVITPNDPTNCKISDEERLSPGDIAIVKSMYGRH